MRDIDHAISVRPLSEIARVALSAVIALPAAGDPAEGSGFIMKLLGGGYQSALVKPLGSAVGVMGTMPPRSGLPAPGLRRGAEGFFPPVGENDEHDAHDAHDGANEDVPPVARHEAVVEHAHSLKRPYGANEDQEGSDNVCKNPNDGFHGTISPSYAILNDRFVCIAPAPVFTRLHGFHDRVPRLSVMFGGVLVPRRVAAADMPADQAQPQVHP